MKQDHIQHNLKCLFNGPDPCRTRAARYLKVLAHPDRMKILWYLNDSEKSVNDLVNYTNIKQTTLSQHLSLLKDRELVESRREGSYVFYRLLNPKVMDIFAMTHDMIIKESWSLPSEKNFAGTQVSSMGFRNRISGKG